jgi:hypothetical protein
MYPTNDQWFQIAMILAMGGWALLFVGAFMTSRSAWRERVLFVAGRAVPLVLAFGYAVGVFSVMDMQKDNGSTLAGVQAFLAEPRAVVVVWVHCLTFDLFVGRWIIDDARTNGIGGGMAALWLVVPLFATLMLGPCGLLAYFLVRFLARGRVGMG